MLFPVVQRELQVAARQRMTYLSRTLSAGILLPLFAGLHSLYSGGRTLGGPHILSILSTIVFVESMLAGIRYTSDCISEERREGTLGLLFLTDLSGLDIVFGKVVARGLRAFFNLLATFPILALTLFLGGVTGRQVTAFCLTLLICIVFSLCAGAFISSRGLRERNVLFATLLFLLAISFLPPAINSLAIRLFGYYGFVDTLVLLSPYHAFSQAGVGFTRTFAPSLWVLALTSCAFILCAAWHVRRTFGVTEPVAAPAPTTRARPSRRGAIFRGNPLVWFAQRDRVRGSRILAMTAFILLFGLFAMLAVEQRWNWAFPVIFLGSYALHAIYKLFLTAESCRQINEDRRSGALELLLVTPISSVSLVRTQLAATWRAWFLPMIALALMNYLWMSHSFFVNDPVLNVVLPLSILFLVTDSVLLPVRSLVNALEGQRYTLTVFKTFLRTLGPPLAVIAYLLAMSIGSNTPADEAIVKCFRLWGYLMVAYTLVLAINARNRLRHFRLLASGDKLPIRWPFRLRSIDSCNALPAQPVARTPLS